MVKLQVGKLKCGGIGKKQMRLCSYVVCCDKGLAPNPFWGFCTLTVCAPNHIGICPQKGDWIIGTTTKKRKQKLLYAMQLTEDKLPFDEYFADPRFEKKKPILLSRNWKQRCGDNIYHRKNDLWKQLPSPFHYGNDALKKDTRHPYAFISKHFYYFGRKAICIPKNYKFLIRERQGCKWHEASAVKNFLSWLQKYHKGIHDDPYDKDMGTKKCGTKKVTKCKG